jgi:protease I
MPILNKKVAILVDNYFEQSEFERPLKELKNAGAQVTVIGVRTKSLQALKHIEKGDQFRAELTIDQADPDDYDALILPGGAINADSMRLDDEVQRWATDFLDNDKLLAAICHAPWILASAGIIRGRRLTSFYTIQDDIRGAGGNWVDQALVIDANLITSRQPDDLNLFCRAIIAVLSQPEIVENFIVMDETELSGLLLGSKGGKA